MSESLEREIGPGIYTRDTGPVEEGKMVAPNSRNRTWLTPEGSKNVGGAFKDGKQVPMQETDLDRLRANR